MVSIGYGRLEDFVRASTVGSAQFGNSRQYRILAITFNHRKLAITASQQTATPMFFTSCVIEMHI